MKRMFSRFSWICALLLLHGLLIACSAHTVGEANVEKPDGFAPIFNGRDMKGWSGGEVKSPSDFEKMSYKQWYDYRNRMHRSVNSHWRIENNNLVGSGSGPDLVSWKHYADFEMWIEWKLSHNSEAGIGLRYGSQIRLIDPKIGNKYVNDSPSGSGGLSTNRKEAITPAKHADRPTSEWNRMFIRMVGPYVTVVLNGEKVVDQVVLEKHL